MKIRNIPFGYEIRNGEVVLNESEADAVTLTFEKYLNGEPLSVIAAWLNGAEIPYSEGSTIWSKCTVKRVIDNVRYTGLFGFPMIIAPADFDAAAAMKSAKYTRKNTPTGVDGEVPTSDAPTPEPRTDHMLKITKLMNEFRRELDKSQFDAELTKRLLMSAATLKYDECRTEAA
jgi:hypothetical protein